MLPARHDDDDDFYACVFMTMCTYICLDVFMLVYLRLCF